MLLYNCSGREPISVRRSSRLDKKSREISYKSTIYACYVAYVTQAIINNLGPLLFIVFQKDLGISIEKIGLLITINFGTQIVVDFLGAKYIDLIGYRPAMVIAHVFCTFGLIGMGIFPLIFPSPFSGLVVSYLTFAMGGGLLEVLVSPIVEAAPAGENKEQAMSLLHSVYCYGHVSVVILTTIGFRIFGIDHWYYLPILWAIVPFLNIFAFTKVPINRLVADHEKLTVKELFSIKIFWVFFLMMLCAGASEQAMSQWSSYFAETGLNVSKTMGDLLGPAAFALTMGFSRTYYGRKGGELNLAKFMTGSSVLCILSYLLAVFAPHPLLSLLGCALCGLSVGIMWPGTISLSAAACRRGGTALFAFLALAGDIGCAAGPAFVSLVAAANNNEIKAGLLAAILFPAALLLIILRNRTTRQQTAMDGS